MSSIKINSNIASLNAQRNFASASKKLSGNFTRLSSGLRINKSSDDAAGLSISESLKTDVKVFNQGVRNLNDGTSLLAIADGAVGELSSIVTRLSELAEQSSNGTISAKQRLALNAEAQSLAKEHNRIARTTEFNGRKLFDSDFGDLSLAAGGSTNSIITDGLGGAIGDGSFKYRISYATTGAGASAIVLDDFTEDGVKDLVTIYTNVMTVLVGNSDGSFKASTSTATVNYEMVKSGDLNRDGFVDLVLGSNGGSSRKYSIILGNGDGTFKSEVTFRSRGDDKKDIEIADFNNDGILDFVGSGGTGDSSAEIFMGNGDGTFRLGQQVYGTGNGMGVTVGDFNSDGIVDFIHMNSGLVSTYQGNGDGTFTAKSSFALAASVTSNSNLLFDVNDDGIEDLVAATSIGVSILIGNNDGTFGASNFFTANNLVYGLNIGDFNGDGKKDIVASSAGSALNILIGNGDGSFHSCVSNEAGSTPYSPLLEDFNGDGVDEIISSNYFGGVNVFFGNTNDGVAALRSFSLKNQTDSLKALDYLSKARTQISKQRGQIGAFQSRVEVATNALQVSSLNYSDANSRITDVDVAEESAKLVANQILQQSAASMLAQANRQPQLALDLLAGI